jgi:hypothetical protein
MASGILGHGAKVNRSARDVLDSSKGAAYNRLACMRLNPFSRALQLYSNGVANR